jgi:cytidyltransferase-like protein
MCQPLTKNRFFCDKKLNRYLFIIFIYILTISTQSIMDKHIAIYIGSFDPFHIGHMRICEYLLQNNLVDMLYILPNTPCRSKPNRLSLEHRLNMIHLQLNSSDICRSLKDQIIIREENADDVIKELKRNGRILHLVMGSDRFSQCLKKGKSPLNMKAEESETQFERYIIIQRVGDKDERIRLNKNCKTFFGKPFTLLTDVPDQAVSSTIVRSGMFDFVCNQTKLYIQKNHLYEIDRIRTVFGDSVISIE